MSNLKRKDFEDGTTIETQKRRRFDGRLLGGIRKPVDTSKKEQGRGQSETKAQKPGKQKISATPDDYSRPTTPTDGGTTRPSTPPSGGSPFVSSPPRASQEFTAVMRSQSLVNYEQEEPVGLLNAGGSQLCYRNAALTMLLYSSHFRRYLLHWHSPHELNASDSPENIRSHQCWVLKSMLSIIQATNSGNDQSQREEDVESLITPLWQMIGFPRGSAKGKFSDPWSNNSLSFTKPKKDQQEDALEFLQWLLNAIDTQLRSFADYSWVAQYQWLLKQKKVKRLLCKVCNHPVLKRTATVTEDYVTSLYITDKKPYTFEGLVSEAMNSSTNMKCGRCKKKSDIDVLERWQHAPAILLFQIMRMTQGQRKKFDKIRLSQDFDASPYLDPQQYGDTKIQYKLSGVVTHKGPGINGGHFRSFVHGGTDRDQWWKLDDDEVEAMSDGSALFDGTGTKGNREYSSYLVLYERNFETEVIKEGRPPSHVHKGKDKDEPLSLTSQNDSKKPIQPGSEPNQKDSEEGDEDAEEVSEDENDKPYTVFDGLQEEIDAECPQAQLEVKVSLGNLELKFDPMVIYHYDMLKPRKVVIEADLFEQNKKTGKAEKVLDVAEVFEDRIALKTQTRLRDIEADWDEIQKTLLGEEREKRWKRAELDAAVDAEIEKRIARWRRDHATPWKNRVTDYDEEDYGPGAGAVQKGRNLDKKGGAKVKQVGKGKQVAVGRINDDEGS